MTVTLIHTGFHGRTHLRFHPIASHYTGTSGIWHRVNYDVGRRLNRAICGVALCQCYELVALTADDLPYAEHFPVTFIGTGCHRNFFIFVPDDGVTTSCYASP